MTTHPAVVVSVSIDRPPDVVYAFAVNPLNLPRWASGLSGSIAQVDGAWIAEAPMGKVRIRFAERNPYGVLDHDVTLPSGEVFSNPMRVVQNAGGSEITFTLFRQPGVSDEDFAADARTIERDLKALKRILEAP
jgi:uncharacterized protein YndB with AHSA1/START domain